MNIVSAGVFAIGALLWTGNPPQAARIDDLTQTALRLMPESARGATTYREVCAKCHGANAEGNAAQNTPALAAQRATYIVRQFAAFSLRERDTHGNHAFVGRKPYSAPQTWRNVAAFLAALPASTGVQVGRGEQVLLGEAVFREQCSSCHGDDADGGDDFIPALRGQHYSYLLQQMHALADGYHRNVDPNLTRFLASMHEEELRATADYLSRLAAAQQKQSISAPKDSAP